jgi:Uma2 family endonuclease
MTAELVRHRFTVNDYYRMAEAGILTEDDRVELLDGEIVKMAPIGSRHAACVDRLNWLLKEKIQESVEGIRVQQPVRLSTEAEPQPDITIVRFREDFYELRHPGPDEIILLIEVADSSLDVDRGIKLPLYAKSGIPVVWIVDLKARTVEVATDPKEDGSGNRHVFKGKDLLILPFASPSVISVNDILG